MLDFLEHCYDVHILVDGVLNCSKEEVPLVLNQMRQAGAQITTSESMLFQLQGAYFMPHCLHGEIKGECCLFNASTLNHLQGGEVDYNADVAMLLPMRDSPWGQLETSWHQSTLSYLCYIITLDDSNI
jgi:hypothetical protein